MEIELKRTACQFHDGMNLRFELLLIQYVCEDDNPQVRCVALIAVSLVIQVYYRGFLVIMKGSGISFLRGKFSLVHDVSPRQIYGCIKEKFHGGYFPQYDVLRSLLFLVSFRLLGGGAIT